MAPHLHCGQKVIAAGASARDAVAQLVDLATARAADRIVTADGVFDHRHEYVRDIRVKLESLGDIDGAIQLDRIGIVVAVFGVGEIEGEEVDRLLAANVDDATEAGPATGTRAGA
jgi:hypothetical protein